LKPGQETWLTMDYTMPEGMGGPHEFWVRVHTNDPENPEQILIAKSDWGP
jgi:hypothetical protein